MEKSSSIPFAGLRFNKKRFANDFSRFKPEDNDEEQILEVSEAIESLAVTGTKKKRKRKDRGSAGIVEAFNVFKISELVKEEFQKSRELEDDSSQLKKEAEKQIEQAAIL